MSSSNPSSNTSNYQTAWNKALAHLDNLPPEQQKYFDCLKPAEQRIFRAPVSPDEIIQILQQTGVPKRSRLAWFNDKLVHPVSQFQGVFEAVATASSAMGAPIWAPLVKSSADEFQKIEGFLNDMLERLKLFKEIEAHFKHASEDLWDYLYNALTNFYIDVINFTLVTAKHFHGSISKYLGRRLLKTFDSDFGEVISSMTRHLDSIPPAVQLAAAKQSEQHYKDLSNQIKAEADLKAAERLAQRKTAAQKWLFSTGVEADQQKHQSNKLLGTCEWLFKDAQIRDWLDSSNSSRLCVFGIPGCGKSVLASTLIHHLKSRPNTEDPVLYFFCKKNDQNRDNPSSVLRTMMFQLLSSPTHGPGFIDIIYDARSKGLSVLEYSIVDLWNLLEKLLENLPVVYFVIDGLDECMDKRGMTDLLQRLTAFSVPGAKVIKTLTTCQPNEFELSWPSIVVEGVNVEADIENYITDRIEQSATLKLPAYRDRVDTAVRKGAGGTFLWAQLMLDTLERSSTWQIEEVLKEIPRGLPEVYSLMLQRVLNLGGRSVERCRKILHWCVAARRRLTVDELLMAVAVSEGVSSHEQYTSGSDRGASLRLLRYECGSLINILKDDTVQLVHTSLQEYLLLGEGVQSQGLLLITNLDLVHIELAKVCLRYNQFECFKAEFDMYNLGDFEKIHLFSRYCIRNWIHHVVLSGNSYAKLSPEIVTFFSSTQGCQWQARCIFFDITWGHLLVLQAKLRAWASLGKGIEPDDVGLSLIGHFVLLLGKKRYEDLTRETGGEDQAICSAACDLAEAYKFEGRYDEALKLYEQALTGYENAIGKEHSKTLRTVHSMAMLYNEQGQYDKALELYERALTGREKALGKDHPSTLQTVNNIGTVYDQQGNYGKALELYERALAGKEKTLGKYDQSTLMTINNIASVYDNQGRHSDALELYGRALAGFEKDLGKEHPTTLGTVKNMALVHERQGLYDQSLELYERALTGYEKILGGEHPNTLGTIHNIASVYNNQNRREKALEFFGRALTGMEKILGKEHPETLKTVDSIASVYKSQRRYEEALGWYERSLTGMEKTLGKENLSTLATIRNMASVYCSQGRYSEALESYERAHAGLKKTLGKEHPDTLKTLDSIASVYKSQGQYKEALEWYMRTLAGKEKALGKEHLSTLVTVQNIAWVYYSQNQYTEALEFYERALAGLEKTCGKEHSDTLAMLDNIASVYDSSGRYSEALEFYGRALTGLENTHGKEHPETMITVNNMGTLYENQGQYGKALEWYGRALAGTAEALGKDHPTTQVMAQNVERAREKLECST